MLRRSDGSAPVDFVLILVPLLICLLLALRTIWLSYEKAQLVVIATRTAQMAALADTTVEEAKAYAVSECERWLGRAAEATIALSDFALATLELDGMAVSVNAIAEARQ